MEFDVDLKFRVRVSDEVKSCVSAERLEVVISSMMDDFNDGRYPFNVEMIKKGVEGVVEGSVHELVVNSMYFKYGSVMVDSPDGRSSTAKAALEADKLLDGLRVRLVGEREELAAVATVKEKWDGVLPDRGNGLDG